MRLWHFPETAHQQVAAPNQRPTDQKHDRSPNAAVSIQTALAEILAGCRRVFAPEGRLVITARAYRRHGKLIDLPGQLIATASDAGLALQARHVALLCGLRGEGFIPRVSFFQLHNHRAGMFPRTLPIAHEDVLVFRALTPKHATRSVSRQPRTVPAQIDLSFRGDRGKR